MPARRHWQPIGLIVAVLALAYLLLSGSDESRVLDQMRELLHAAEQKPGEPAAERRARIAASFEANLRPDVRLDAPELEQTVQGRPELAALAVAAAAPFVSLRFQIEQAEINASSSGADVTAVIVMFTNDGSSELTDTRQVTIRLVRIDGAFRVSSVQIGRARREEPEARP